MVASALAYYSDYVPEENQRIARFVVQRPAHAHATAIEGAEEPKWKEATVLKLVHLLGLPEGWDSYGARQIQQAAVNSAFTLLELAAPDETPSPSIVPTSEGGVQLEWHAWGVDLELDVAPAGTAELYFQDRRAGEVLQTELGADLERLASVLTILSERAAEERSR
jgi:hypothetical protein